MSVNRYEFELYHCNGGEMLVSDTGDYVSYEDYAALEARCAAQAAELRAVEAIHNEAVFITDDHYEECPAEVQKIIRSLAVLQISAYQAFLAEVRAQGVEMSINRIHETGSLTFGDCYIALNGLVDEILRKGVQS